MKAAKDHTAVIHLYHQGRPTNWCLYHRPNLATVRPTNLTAVQGQPASFFKEVFIECMFLFCGAKIVQGERSAKEKPKDLLLHCRAAAYLIQSK